MSRLINCNRRRNGIFKNSRNRLDYLKQKRLQQIKQSSKKSYNKYSIQKPLPHVQNNQFGYNNQYCNRNNFNNYVSEQINNSTNLNQYQSCTPLNNIDNTKPNNVLENNNKNFFQNYQPPIQQSIHQQYIQQQPIQQQPIYQQQQNTTYNIGNIIDNELGTSQILNNSRFNLISALDKRIRKKNGTKFGN